jgi:hypothetical protein
VGFFVLKSFNPIFICSLTKKEFKMALCFIRRKEDNVIVYGNSDITFVSNGLSGYEAGFTIEEATEEWGISATGWNDAEYDNVVWEATAPEGWEVGSHKITGTDTSNYQFEL